MRMGPFDGSVEDVKDLLENNGLTLEDYLEKPPASLKTCFLVVPIMLFTLSLFVLAIMPVNSTSWVLRVLYAISFGSGTWICTNIQIRFRNGIATFCVAMGVIITVLIAAGLLSPREAADIVRDLKSK